MRIEDCCHRDERPEEVMFEFSTSLEEALMMCVVWKEGSCVPFNSTAIVSTMVLPAAEVF